MKKALIIIGSLLLLIAGGIAGAFFLLRNSGEKHLKESMQGPPPELAAAGELPVEEVTEKEQAVWQEGWIKHNGRIYAYNEDILTFLIMGIDRKGEVKEVKEGTNGGQADALFLLVFDPHKRATTVIGINRNLMTDIEIYDGNGKYVETRTAQIAVQHGFGNGVEKSCEYQVEAVKRVLYDLPIGRYAAINMSAVSVINDLAGGVDVTVNEDLTKADKALKKGETVHLTGKQAFRYVQWRDREEFGSADLRLERQKQYLKALIGKLRKAVKEDPSIIAKLYQTIRNEMTTDLTMDELMYLTPEVADYSFGSESFRMIPGKTVMGEKYEEFYPDKMALFELILDVFYEEVETD
ncbi:MAG: LCP family protein [Lachnospiraceae bacterium]|nr:LCP family protein [Lachnospiraceae bacterium]